MKSEFVISVPFEIYESMMGSQLDIKSLALMIAFKREDEKFCNIDRICEILERNGVRQYLVNNKPAPVSRPFARRLLRNLISKGFVTTSKVGNTIYYNVLAWKKLSQDKRAIRIGHSFELSFRVIKGFFMAGVISLKQKIEKNRFEKLFRKSAKEFEDLQKNFEFSIDEEGNPVLRYNNELFRDQEAINKLLEEFKEKSETYKEAITKNKEALQEHNKAIYQLRRARRSSKPDTSHKSFYQKKKGGLHKVKTLKLSNSQIGKIFGQSPSTGFNIKSHMNKMGITTMRENNRIVFIFNDEEHREEIFRKMPEWNNRGIYWTDGIKVYRRCGSSYHSKLSLKK